MQQGPEKLFHVGVKGLVAQGASVLILKAIGSDGKAYWDFPGGRVQNDETLQDTLLREISEEVPSISDIQVGPIVHAARLPKSDPHALGLLLLFFAVQAHIPEIKLNPEHIDYRWVTWEEIEDLEREQNTRLTFETEKQALLNLFSQKVPV